MEDTSLETNTALDIQLTEEARAKILEALAQKEDKDSLRLEARATGAVDFQYAMRLISADEITEEDFVLRDGDLRVAADPESARNLKGAVVDYEDRIVRSGFKFNNPNKPEVPSIGSGPREDLKGPVGEKVQYLLDTELNPAVAAHGGQISLMGVKDNKVYLTFGGGCHGCGMVDVTLKQGVESRIRELIPEVEEVVDTTDHAAGENPYYA